MTKTSKRNLLLAFCAATCLTVGLSAISMQTASATTGTQAGATEFFMDKGASVRVMEGESGIRWTTRVDETWYGSVAENATTVEFHTLVTAADNVNDDVTKLVVGADASLEIKDLKAEVEVADVAFDNYDTDGDGEADSTAKVFTYYGSIIYDDVDLNDKTAAYATELIARSYISVDGTIYYATAADTARDMRAVALAASEDEEKFAKFDEDEQDIVKGYFGAKETDVDLTSAEADEKAYCFEATNTVTASTASDYAVAYLGAKRIGTVAGSTITLDSAKMTLGDSYALTVFDADGNYAKVESFKYVTTTLEDGQDLLDAFYEKAASGYYVMTSNITPIYTWRARTAATFSGTLDGQGYAIENIVFGDGTAGQENIPSGLSASNQKKYKAFGLFYQLLDGAVIKNIAMTNITAALQPSGAFAYIVAGANITFENVYVSYETVGANVTHLGGLVGCLNTSTNTTSITANNCVVVMPENATYATGYIAGYINGSDKRVSLQDCTFIGGDGESLAPAYSANPQWTLDMENDEENKYTLRNLGGNEIMTVADAATYDKSGWSAMQIAAWNADNA